MNKAIIIGNITQDIEPKQTTQGTTVVNTSVATNSTYIKDGEKIQETEFHNIVAFGKTAELLENYTKKGDKIYIEGKLKTSSWEKDGIKKYKTDIIVEKIEFLQPKKDNFTPKDEFDVEPKKDNGDVNLESIPF